MRILAIGDIHYVSDSSYIGLPERKYELGPEFVERILRREKENFDVIVVCGDFVDNRTLSCTENDFLEIKKIIEKEKKPFIFVRGNHDIEFSKFCKLSGNSTLPLIYGEYIFYPFCDNYLKDEKCYRKKQEIEKFKKFSQKFRDKKIITIQHNIIYPEIEGGYPYNFENGEEILNLYEENNVLVSISGHYHKGIKEKKHKGIYFLTLPAICESPFSYYIIEINKGKIKFQKKSLCMEAPFPLIDFHCHTEFAYCGENVESKKNIERAKIFGLDGIVLTEHSGQLYLSKDDYWGYKFLDGVDIIYQSKKEGKSRIEKFKEKIFPIKNNYVKVGMEVECDRNGKITLLPEDKKGIDYLIGAVHYLPEEYKVSYKKIKNGFLKFTEFVCRNNIDILAHPLRYFVRNNILPPKDIYSDVVKILKEYNVCAELNFHTNNPDPVFFERCIENGIKISLASDAHNLLEVGDFSKHIEFLKKIGVRSGENLLTKWVKFS